MKIDARYIASVPNSLVNLERDLDQKERSTLAALFHDDDLERVAGSRPHHLTFKIERALRQRSRDEALSIAKGVVTYLKTAFALQDEPPSEAELEEFISERQLGLQDSGFLLNLHGLMTAEGPGFTLFTDPYTDDIADPLMWILAIERVERINSQM